MPQPSIVIAGAGLGGLSTAVFLGLHGVGTLVVDVADASSAAAIEAEGVRCVVTPTVMSTPERAEALGRAVVDAAG